MELFHNHSLESEPQGVPSMDSFTLFPNLLPELRILIWQYALLHPRLVLIYKHSTRITTISPHIRRTVTTPLLSTSQESRLEALKYYFPPSLGLLQPQPSSNTSTLFPTFLTPPNLNDRSQKPFPVGPGTDIIYISGNDPSPPRRRTPVTWTVSFLSSELDSASPSFSPIKHLAIDLALLLSTSYSKTPKFKMPHGIWKFIILDLKKLESLIMVRSCGCEEEHWGVKDVEGSLMAAKNQFMEFWEQMMGYGGDDSIGEGKDDEEEGSPGEEVKRLKEWRMPRVEVLELEELVARCWV
ncbi:hypothetical protein BDZ45DRAFT_797100 [Acephala macrosclerotiorum]|nr:hypothetical protein BDZ45DRAFT_797100 [Acephala macrosclerotiorum]